MDALPSQELPPGWAWTSIGALGAVNGGLTKNPKRASATDQLPYLRVANVLAARLNLAEVKRIGVFPDEVARGSLKADDLLIVEGNGSADQIGRCALWSGAIAPCFHQNHLIRVRMPEPALARWTLYWLLSSRGRASIEAVASSTSGLHTLSISKISQLGIPVAPLRECERVVAAIENALEEVEAGEAALARAREGLTQFRASLLHAACTGALTADWRAANPTNTTTERSDALPPGWCTLPVSATGRVQLGRQRAPQHHDGPHMRPYLRVANVFEDRIDTTDVMSMNFAPDEFASYRLEPGDILLNEGQSAELVGRPAMFRGEVENCCFTNTLVRYRAGPLVNRDFALLVFRWWLRTGAFQRIAKITTNIAHLGAGRFGELLMPVPPLEEQAEIVRRAEDLLGEINDDALVVGYTSSALRQAVLHTAFTGRLVPQDPADEPAAALLARLCTAPAAARRPRARRTATQPDLIETPA